MVSFNIQLLAYGDKPTLEANASDGSLFVTIIEEDARICFSGPPQRVLALLQHCRDEALKVAGSLHPNSLFPPWDFSEKPSEVEAPSEIPIAAIIDEEAPF